jgi:hypothetical protein
MLEGMRAHSVEIVCASIYPAHPYVTDNFTRRFTGPVRSTMTCYVFWLWKLQALSL